jgi:hypothetical protein
MVERTGEQLDALERALADGAEMLPDIMLRDLRATLRGLRGQAVALGREAQRLQRELAGADDAAASEAASRIEGRLRRLETLQRAGQTVDTQEIDDLRRGLEAHRKTLEAVEGLEAHLTVALARLLEIGSTAQQVRRELRRDPTAGQSSVRLLEQLREEATAAAGALREVEKPVGSAAEDRPDPTKNTTGARPEPSKSAEPVRPEPSKGAEPARLEPTKGAEPARLEPTKGAEPARQTADEDERMARARQQELQRL